MYGYWGKFKKVNEKMTKVYIGPMTKETMLEFDDTYRHIFTNKKPKELINVHVS